jgi:PPOX class probable F420-dependent enzyme
MRRRVADARVARLATVGRDGRPHLVPLCFAVRGDTLVSAVDAKPKTTKALRRLDHIRAHPSVSVLIDDYHDDWSRLWWVRLDGSARVVGDGPERDRAIELLTAKYDQYRPTPLSGPVIVVTVDRWSGWSFAG